MFKQPKKYYRYDFVKSDRRRKAGFRSEIALAVSEEHRALCRAKRGRRALYYYSDFSYDREAEPRSDQLSWKHRCKKRHQWVKHRYSLHEMDFLARRCREHRAHLLLKVLQYNSGWTRFHTRDDPMLREAIQYLWRNAGAEIKEYGDWFDPSVIDLRLKRGNEPALRPDEGEWEQEAALMLEEIKRKKHKDKRLPISHKYIRDKYRRPAF